MHQLATSSTDLREELHRRRKAIHTKFQQAALKHQPPLVLQSPKQPSADNRPDPKTTHPDFAQQKQNFRFDNFLPTPKQKSPLISIHNPQPVYRLPAAPGICKTITLPCSLAQPPAPSISWVTVIKLSDIIKTTAAYFGVPVQDLISYRRTKPIVEPRQIACYLGKTLTSQSLPEIGRRLGGRDHTTVLHAARKIESSMQNDLRLRIVIKTLTIALTFKVEM
jgi:chromosomal replication initiation ATPase DnaA